MTDQTRLLPERFMVRKTAAQKEAFRRWLTQTLTRAGYTVSTECGGTLVKSRNVVVGSPEQASVVYTAHYDTCAVLPFPNLITPCNLPVYLLFQFLLCVPILALAVGAEVLLLRLWPECPMWLAMLAVCAVLLFCFWWMLSGPANRHTANDNTSGVATLLEIALTLPPEARGRTAFVFFDNEERGLLGASQFSKAHGRALRNTLLINFDCVGDGDHILFFPNRTVKKQAAALELLEQSFSPCGGKTVSVVGGFGFYPSDQMPFPRGVGVAALHKGWPGYWLGRIHTGRDTVLQEDNIELLRRGAVALAESAGKNA